ncbi:MAG TPA: HEPN domain-containing protein [Thermomicrobiaceae bacterium]|nr:HEPN domain-containing protein [Thermomicrobiaceae bacterium]
MAKAEESLATATSELANRRYNSCANRCYYACFQAAIAALLRAGIHSPRPDGGWPHAFVQAQFAVLVTRRKEYPSQLRDALPMLMALRHRADYQPAQVSERQVARAVRTARDFVAAVVAKGDDVQ